MPHALAGDAIQNLHGRHDTKPGARVRANLVNARRRRIYSELLPLAELGRDETLRALVERELELVVALWPSTLAETIPIAARYLDRGGHVTLWPMLDDADGRWISVENVEPFASFVRVVADQAGDVCRELLIDLEPPIGAMQRWLASPLRSFDKQPQRVFKAGRRALHKLLDELGARGIARTAAVIPLCVYDQPGKPSWQRLLGTPVDELPFDTIHVMAYTTLFQGYSRGLLGRKDARQLLDELCVATQKKYGERGGISLGCTGVGALGDEQAYRALAELAEDLQHTRAAGLADVALFDLNGILRRDDAGAWLDQLARRDEPQAAAIDAVKARPNSRRARILAWLFAQSFGPASDDTDDLID